MTRLNALWRSVSDAHHPAASRLADALAYEVVSVLWSGMLIGLLAWSALGGDIEDVYAWLGTPPARSAEHVTVIEIGAQAMSYWGETEADTQTPRDLLAELVDVARLAGTRAVALDVLLDPALVPSTSEDRLVAAAAAHGRVVTAIQYEQSSANLPAYAIAPGAGQERVMLPGFANLVLERSRLFDGPDTPPIVRKSLLQRDVRMGRADADWTLNAMSGLAAPLPAPSLALATAWLAATGRTVDASTRTDLSENLRACLAQHEGCTRLGLPGIAPGMLQDAVPIPYRGREDVDGIPTIDAAELLGMMAAARSADPSAPPDRSVLETSDAFRSLRGRVVVIGRVHPVRDMFITTRSPPFVGRPDTHGVHIQAQIVEGLLSGRMRTRSANPWVERTLAGFTVLALLWSATTRSAGAIGLRIVAACVIALAVGTLCYYLEGPVLPLGQPVGAALATWTILCLIRWARREAES